MCASSTWYQCVCPLKLGKTCQKPGDKTLTKYYKKQINHTSIPLGWNLWCPTGQIQTAHLWVPHWSVRIQVSIVISAFSLFFCAFAFTWIAWIMWIWIYHGYQSIISIVNISSTWIYLYILIYNDIQYPKMVGGENTFEKFQDLLPTAHVATIMFTQVVSKNVKVLRSSKPLRIPTPLGCDISPLLPGGWDPPVDHEGDGAWKCRHGAVTCEKGLTMTIWTIRTSMRWQVPFRIYQEILRLSEMQNMVLVSWHCISEPDAKAYYSVLRIMAL